jgi:hypothetical protein
MTLAALAERAARIALTLVPRDRSPVAIVLRVAVVFVLGAAASWGLGWGQSYFRDNPDVAGHAVDVLFGLYEYGFIGALVCYAVAWCLRQLNLAAPLRDALDQAGNIGLGVLIGLVGIAVILLCFVVAYQCLAVIGTLAFHGLKWVLSAVGLIG